MKKSLQFKDHKYTCLVKPSYYYYWLSLMLQIAHPRRSNADGLFVLSLGILYFTHKVGAVKMSTARDELFHFSTHDGRGTVKLFTRQESFTVSPLCGRAV